MSVGLRWYLISSGCYLLPGGIHMVLFPWLVAVVLEASPLQVGVAQMAGQLPMLLLILWGGLLGDRVDQRRLLLRLQGLAVLPPLVMASLLGAGVLDYGLLLGWALALGTLGAFAQPARDALLNRVAGPDIQRVVTLAVGVQFGIQILGFGLGSTAEWFGPVPLILLQAAGMGAAAWTTSRIPPLPALPEPPRRSALVDIADGLAVVWRTPAIRSAILLTLAVGFFFAGSYMVILPLFVRDVYAGTATGIAGAFAANMAGTCTTIFWLMRRGGLQRPGRALLLGSGASVLILSLLHLELPRWGFYLVVYLWGLNGGISMTMSRALVQERAPESHRARVMSVYSLGIMGGMPLGSLFLGWCVGEFGVRDAVLVPVAGMALVVGLMALLTPLWHEGRTPAAAHGPPGAGAAAD